ncbi:hypothetical protein Pelo_15562 [Pelomyxa schiedti]|nr:hypothetical protein Pelo_15562 [Pelomyxa schiedti]
MRAVAALVVRLGAGARSVLTMAWPPDRESAARVARAVASSGCVGVTSVGCGGGLVEWLLCEWLDVRAIDLDRTALIAEAQARS